MSSRWDETTEWLEADGRGGFASGTASGIRTRRYHALLLVATTPPTGRFVLVNGFDAWVSTGGGSFALTTQRYDPGVTSPDGQRRIEAFASDPWPHWVFAGDDGTRIEHEMFVPRGLAVTVLRWRRVAGDGPATLALRPFLSGRDYHALHHENAGLRVEPERSGERLVWRPYPGVPAVISLANAEYTPQPDWYRNFLYDVERARGLDDREDLMSPGLLRWNLAAGDAVWVLAAGGHAADALDGGDARGCADRLRATELRRRARFASPLERAADAYIVSRATGQTIIAGYPWFTDWGRDTFIALRGLCLATGRLDDARRILLEWADTVSEGMLPNRFPDGESPPEFNAVDASLWYIVAVQDYLQQVAASRARLGKAERARLHAAVEAILDGYQRGTRFGIRAAPDGLLAAGAPGVQLTWMDARVGDRVVTPRSGKPVEVQALWLNALRIASAWSERWAPLSARASAAFAERFWNDTAGGLYDVIDCDHQAGTVDATLRPNQIFAVGGLPFAVVEDERARRIVDVVEQRLWTPLGLRSLAPGEPGYIGRYAGGVNERDGAYHQGTAWPWLLGPFVEAWVRVRGGTVAAKREARARFLTPLLDHLSAAGAGHISEVADGDGPHAPGGCPFQAWSVGEALRLDRVVLAE